MSLGILYNVLSTEQVNTLHECAKDFSARSYFLFRDDPVFPAVQDIILPSIKKIEGKDNIYKAFYLNIDYAAGIHVDEYYDQNPLNTYLFPLEVEPVDTSKPYSTHTVVFNESYYSDYKPTDERYSVDEFWKNSSPVTCNAKLWGAPEYVGHCRPTQREFNLSKLSIEATFKWHPGSMVFFPRNRLHCSSNNELLNVKVKRALTVFTTGDEIRKEMK